MKQLIQVLIFKVKIAHSMHMANKTTGIDSTYWYQKYVYYTNKLNEMEMGN